MPENFGYKEKIMHSLSELSPVDAALQKRAEWIVENTGMEKYFKKDGMYLDVGTGKGHVTERILKDLEQRGEPLRGYISIDVADKPLKKVQKREGLKKSDAAPSKNSKNFSWATAEALPFKSNNFDGVSFVFSIHHMNKSGIDTAMAEAKRVLKKDGHLFIVEDLVDTEAQREITEKTDRKLNWEGKDEEHNYRSSQEWKAYFVQNGFELVNEKLFESATKKGSIKHGFYALKLAEAESE